METHEALSKIKEDFVALKEQGVEALQTNALINYINDIEKDASFSIDSRRLQYQGQLAEYDAQMKVNLEMFKSVIDSGKEAINATMIVNGGAVIALLGFLANTVSKSGSYKLAGNLSHSLLMFGIGVLLAAIAFGFKYFTQYSYAHDYIKTGTFFNVTSWFLVIASYTMFGIGLYCAYFSLNTFFVN